MLTHGLLLPHPSKVGNPVSSSVFLKIVLCFPSLSFYFSGMKESSSCTIHKEKKFMMLSCVRQQLCLLLFLISSFHPSVWSWTSLSEDLNVFLLDSCSICTSITSTVPTVTLQYCSSLVLFSYHYPHIVTLFVLQVLPVLSWTVCWLVWILWRVGNESFLLQSGVCISLYVPSHCCGFSHSYVTVVNALSTNFNLLQRFWQ